MKKVIKKTGKSVMAYRLGDHSMMEQEMIASGKIRRRQDGRFELFSQEAVNGEGELADKGDYFKVDNSDHPYPNGKQWFEQNHRHLEGDAYMQLSKPLDAWDVSEPWCREMEFLLKTGSLVIHREDTERYFEAVLWGALLTAPRDSVIVFYHVERSDDGEIVDISFNFINRKEFELTYEWY